MIRCVTTYGQQRPVGRFAAIVAAIVLISSLYAARAGVRIVDVKGAFVGAQSGLAPVYLKKFANFGSAAGPREVHIEWEAEEDLPAGTLVIFEYHTRSERYKVVYSKLGLTKRGRQRTILVLPESEVLTAWRARITVGTATRATRTAPEWR